MANFRWLQELSELTERSAPPGWKLHSSGSYGGLNLWSYFHYGADTGTFHFVDVFATLSPMSNNAQVEIQIDAIANQEHIPNVTRTILNEEFHPNDFKRVEESLQLAYQQVQQLNPTSEED